MKRGWLGLAVIGVVLATAVPQAQADLLSLGVAGTTKTCDNSTAAGVTACLAYGFVTSLGDDTISYTGGTINGIQFGSVVLTSNSPGTSGSAFVLDTKTQVQNVAGSMQTAMVNFGVNNFTQPVGPAFLSASQTANWTTSTAGDLQTFQVWARNTNDFIVPGGTATAITAPCVSPGGAVACGQQSPVTAVGLTAPYALTGSETITMAAGTVGTFTGTSTAIVPEPTSLVLLGSGLVGIAVTVRRRRQLSRSRPGFGVRSES